MIVLYDLGLILVTIVFQTTLAEFAADVVGARPDLILILVVNLGLLRGKRAGIGYGWALGLLQDALSGTLLGQNALSKGLAGFVAGILHRNLGDLTALTQILMVVLATVFDAGIHQGVSFLLYGAPAGAGVLRTLGILVLLNAAIAPVFGWVMRIVLRRVDRSSDPSPLGRPR